MKDWKDEARAERAHGLAMQLLRNGSGEEGARLVITTSDGRDLGGWGLSALVEQFDSALSAAYEQGVEKTITEAVPIVLELCCDCGGFVQALPHEADCSGSVAADRLRALKPGAKEGAKP